MDKCQALNVVVLALPKILDEGHADPKGNTQQEEAMKTYPFARGLLLAILCLCLLLFVSNAGDALAQKQSASEVDNLREMLKDKDPNIRRNAAQALGHMGPGAKAAVPALTETLYYRRPENRPKPTIEIWVR